ncbi:MAG: hypothetical protein ABFE08_08285 [Armatimonadia bacterium]
MIQCQAQLVHGQLDRLVDPRHWEVVVAAGPEPALPAKALEKLVATELDHSRRIGNRGE